MSRWRVSAVSLLCVLIGVTVAFRPVLNPAASAGDVNDSRVASESAQGNSWLLNGRTFDEQHFSPLRQVTDKNVSQLGFDWYLDVDSAMGVSLGHKCGTWVLDLEYRARAGDPEAMEQLRRDVPKLLRRRQRKAKNTTRRGQQPRRVSTNKEKTYGSKKG